MTWNFAWNRQVTFADREHGSIPGQYLGFCAASLTGAVLNWTTSVALWRWAGFAQIAASLVGIGLAAAVNYVLCSVFVFGRKPATQPAAATTSAAAFEPARDTHGAPATLPFPAAATASRRRAA
jgi:dolichol-phosphate mannosyltransferase